MKYFKKELIQNPLTLANGKSLSYTHTVNNTGVVVVDETTNPSLAAELQKICGRYGVSELTEAQFEEFKKKSPAPMRALQSSGPRLFAPSKDPFKSGSATQALPSAPILQPSPTPTPSPVPAVTAPAGASPAAEQSPAGNAMAPAASTPAKPSFNPRRGSVKKAGTPK